MALFHAGGFGKSLFAASDGASVGSAANAEVMVPFSDCGGEDADAME